MDSIPFSANLAIPSGLHEQEEIRDKSRRQKKIGKGFIRLN
jgi:hypothetical protein